MFGLKEAEIAQVVRVVSSTVVDGDAIRERFARAAWTGIAEPGDRIAGELVAALGPGRAYEALVDEWAPERILGEAGAPVAAADLRTALERWQPRVKPSAALIALRQAARYGVRLRIPGEHDWPAGMEHLGSQGPLALWTRGTDEAYEGLATSISLVGARAATGYGEHVTMEASAGLCDRGYTIVSGAAYGIDGMAHRAALASNGLTAAFLAGGVDRFYPSGHDALLQRIVDHGVVISELPCGSAPTKWRFLQRNRLIAAASLATIVLEAGTRSGSLNTARHAFDVGRPVGAVPGPVTSAASAGCHVLLREYDAVCVTNASEMAQLAPLSSDALDLGLLGVGSQTEQRTSSTVTRVLDALSARSSRATNDIAARSGLSVAEVQSVLGQLELAREVRDTGKGWFKS